jgi:hypothetical protein
MYACMFIGGVHVNKNILFYGKPACNVCVVVIKKTDEKNNARLETH